LTQREPDGGGRAVFKDDDGVGAEMPFVSYGEHVDTSPTRTVGEGRNPNRVAINSNGRASRHRLDEELSQTRFFFPSR